MLVYNTRSNRVVNMKCERMRARHTYPMTETDTGESGYIHFSYLLCSYLLKAATHPIQHLCTSTDLTPSSTT